MSESPMMVKLLRALTHSRRTNKPLRPQAECRANSPVSFIRLLQGRQRRLVAARRGGMRFSPQARLLGPLGLSLGTALGFKLAGLTRQNTARMPRAEQWQQALLEAYGSVASAVMIANAEVHYRDLIARAPRFGHRALRAHFERGIAPGMALYQIDIARSRCCVMSQSHLSLPGCLLA